MVYYAAASDHDDDKCLFQQHTKESI